MRTAALTLTPIVLGLSLSMTAATGASAKGLNFSGFPAASTTTQAETGQAATVQVKTKKRKRTVRPTRRLTDRALDSRNYRN